ncbi:MAG: hypothetical protein H0V60_07950 [Actinobacteria bacterium]|nr:hypothetical protein [Actinomycetota bacterium]
MAGDESSRQALRRRLDEVLGREHALTLMDQLSGAGAATTGDILALEERMDSKMDARFIAFEERMDSKMDARFIAFEERMDGKLETLEGRMDSKLAALEERMDSKLAALEERMSLRDEALEHRLTATFRNELITQTRTFFLGMVGSITTVATLAFAAARLI